MRRKLEYPFELNLSSISQSITQCEQCPRLRKYCASIATTKRKMYENEKYWGKPVAGFGDPAAKIVIVGLAPAAHGANRTGRIFTGDRSGEWLYRSLHKFGFANQAHSEAREDGLVLREAYVSCVVRCAPPDNKPSKEELHRCVDYLAQEIAIMPEVRVWVALGQIALEGLWPLLPRTRAITRPKFKHGALIELGPSRWLLLSYHPSQQNTFTGRLTEPMFDSIFAKARELL